MSRLFEPRLDELRDTILRMGSRCEAILAKALQALQIRDVALAEEVKTDDLESDRLDASRRQLLRYALRLRIEAHLGALITVLSRRFACPERGLWQVAADRCAAVLIHCRQDHHSDISREVLEAELELERTHIAHFRKRELAQLKGFFKDMGVRDGHIDGVVAAFADNDEALLNAMAALEFGVVESERRSPYRAMAASGLLFLAGSLPSVLPFALIESPTAALVWVTTLTLSGLFIVGVVKGNVAHSSRVRSGLENMVIAGLGGLVAWFIGDAVGANFA